MSGETQVFCNEEKSRGNHGTQGVSGHKLYHDWYNVTSYFVTPSNTPEALYIRRAESSDMVQLIR